MPLLSWSPATERFTRLWAGPQHAWLQVVLTVVNPVHKSFHPPSLLPSEAGRREQIGPLSDEMFNAPRDSEDLSFKGERNSIHFPPEINVLPATSLLPEVTGKVHNCLCQEMNLSQSSCSVRLQIRRRFPQKCFSLRHGEQSAAHASLASLQLHARFAGNAHAQSCGRVPFHKEGRLCPPLPPLKTAVFSP